MWLRKHPDKRNAEVASQILHMIFWLTVAPAMAWGFISPGLEHYDELLHIPPLTKSGLWSAMALFFLLIGASFILMANVSLWMIGKGANAILLTRQLVVNQIYKCTRNPMSLGLYLVSIGMGLLVRSSYVLLCTILILIPVHIFYLKFFEEKELELRMDQHYLEYKHRVPFLFPRVFPNNN